MLFGSCFNESSFTPCCQIARATLSTGVFLRRELPPGAFLLRMACHQAWFLRDSR